MTIARPVRRDPARGRVRSRIEALERLSMPPVPAEVIPPHPLPDLDGMAALEIGDALCAAVTEAHGDDPLWSSDAETGRLCRRCLAALDIAREAAGQLEAGGGINPLIEVFDDELLWRDVMAHWAAIHPDATFVRAAFLADQQQKRSEHLYIDHYPGQIPPWVIVPA